MQPAFSHWIGVHGTLSKGSWSAGAECLPWVVGLASVGPGGGSLLKKKNDPRTCLCCYHNLDGQENKSEQETRLALKCWAGLLEGKERIRCLGCLNSCNESAALFPQSSPCYTAAPAMPRKTKQSQKVQSTTAQPNHTAGQSQPLNWRVRDVFRWGLTRAAKTCCRSKGEREEEWRGKHWRGKGQTWLCCKQSQLG